MPVLKKLATLSLYSNNINDYTPLLRLPNLIDLTIGGTVINNGTKIPSLPKLVRLSLQNAQISLDDTNLFERLSSYVNLEYLDFSDNQLENLVPFATYFNFKNSTVEDRKNP